MGFTAGGAGVVGFVDGVLEDDFGHGLEVMGWRGWMDGRRGGECGLWLGLWMEREEG